MSKKQLHYPTSLTKLCLVGMMVFTLFTGLGCPASWEAVKDSNNVDELRKFIQENPEDPMIDEARVRVTKIEFRNAKRANTRYAYQVFIERHPESSLALDARRKLEEMDFQNSTSDPSLESLNGFLKLHPKGRQADRVRRLRDKLLCNKILSLDDPDEIRNSLKTYKTLQCVESLKEKVKILEVKKALKKNDLVMLQGVVDHFPNDPAVKKVKDLILDLQVDALLDAGLFDRAKKLIIEKSGSERIDTLLRRVSKRQDLWNLASFEFLVPSARPMARYFQKNERLLKKLSSATKRLKRYRGSLGTPVWKDADPLNRWLSADHLADVVDESASEILFELLGDSFLEVRRRAQDALAAQVKSLGPTRSRIWLAGKLRQLRDKAKFGPLLFKYAVVFMILGDDSAAYAQLEHLNRDVEEPDLLALHDSVLLAMRLGRKKDAARLARDFSQVSERYMQQRMTQWSTGAKVGKSARGWLTLRQVCGLMRIWKQTLQVFQSSSEKPEVFSSYMSLFGPWLKKSEISLNGLTSWLADEEKRWSKAHSNYRSCVAPDQGVSSKVNSDDADLKDLESLAIFAGGLTRPSIVWASCCHSNKSVRMAAWVIRLEDDFTTWLQLACLIPMIAF